MSSGAVPVPGDIWGIDPVGLREVVLDREQMAARLAQCPPLERVWVLCVLDRAGEAVAEGLELLAGAGDRLRPLLVLAQAYQRQDSWLEAARLQEEALRLARTRPREAMVRRQIGLRLLGEGRYGEAAAELEWARDLYRSARREHHAEACQHALERARTLGPGRPGAPGARPGLR